MDHICRPQGVTARANRRVAYVSTGNETTILSPRKTPSAKSYPPIGASSRAVVIMGGPVSRRSHNARSSRGSLGPSSRCPYLTSLHRTTLFANCSSEELQVVIGAVGKLHWMLNPGLAINEKVFGQRIPQNNLQCPVCKTSLIFCKNYRGTTEYEGFGKYEYKCKHCGEPLPCIKTSLAAP